MSINPAYFADLTEKVNNAQTCAELQAASAQIMDALNAQVSVIEAQITALGPLAALLSAPTSPTAAVTWITNFISAQIAPQYAAVAKYTAQVTQLATEISNLTGAIEAAASRIGNCSVSI